jgi:hypothetical protein
MKDESNLYHPVCNKFNTEYFHNKGITIFGYLNKDIIDLDIQHISWKCSIQRKNTSKLSYIIIEFSKQIPEN